MTPERWRQVGELFARALGEPVESRAAWLASCDAPDEVRHEVAGLLVAHDSADGFLDGPGAGTAIVSGAVALPTGLTPGAVLGAYRLVRVLGRGGMGVVFEAEDTRLHRRVALKAVSSPGGGDTDQQRLRREARAAAALVHPNIATVYALEEIEGRAYLATEYLDGETLREALRRGPLPRADALRSRTRWLRDSKPPIAWGSSIAISSRKTCSACPTGASRSSTSVSRTSRARRDSSRPSLV